MADNPIALVVAAILGGVLGIAGSVTTTVLTEQHAADAETKRAIGAARVLADDFRRAEDVSDQSLQDCTYRFSSIQVELPIEDRVLLAWRLNADQWTSVANGLSQVEIQIGRADVKHAFVRDDVTQLRYLITKLVSAENALDGVTGQQPSTEGQVNRELSHGSDC